MAGVTLDRVDKVFPDGTHAVRSLSLDIGDGEFVVLVGPSGCGKTTALRMVAGLEEASSGTIALGGEVINGLDPGDRDLAMVFQHYALYPHMSVYDNIGFPLKLAGVAKAERDEKVRRIARTVGLTQELNRKPSNLSGGQRQRVAMARAIVREPRAFLMDEPLSNLDAKLRVQMRAEVATLQRELGITTVYVTHDQVEAMTLGSRVAVMRGGVLQQCAPPQELYDRPTNVFVATFTGAPPMSLLEGTLMADADAVEVGSQVLALDARERVPGLRRLAGGPVLVGVRPERLEDAALTGGAPEGRRLTGEVVMREALGSDVLVHVAVTGTHALSAATWELSHEREDPAEREEQPGRRDATIVVGRFSPDSAVGLGARVEMVVAPGVLQCFDPASGEAIR
jgi:multiple sugar transport system ATP-binding protein